MGPSTNTQNVQIHIYIQPTHCGCVVVLLLHQPSPIPPSLAWPTRGTRNPLTDYSEDQVVLLSRSFSLSTDIRFDSTSVPAALHLAAKVAVSSSKGSRSLTLIQLPTQQSSASSSSRLDPPYSTEPVPEISSFTSALYALRGLHRSAPAVYRPRSSYTRVSATRLWS